jgi:hypothetical protein
MTVKDDVYQLHRITESLILFYKRSIQSIKASYCADLVILILHILLQPKLIESRKRKLSSVMICSQAQSIKKNVSSKSSSFDDCT